MTARDQQFCALYRQHRVEHQRGFYDGRRREFRAAQDESVWLVAVLMVFTAAAAAFATANVGGLERLWSVLQVAFPALVTALAAYTGLYAFERQAKIYGDAANNLLRARADAPDVRPLLDDGTAQGVLRAYVQQVGAFWAPNRRNGVSWSARSRRQSHHGNGTNRSSAFWATNRRDGVS